jgi:putative ABC transport system permease protein
MPNDTHDWHADIRARLAAARLHPQDEAEVVEEVAQHLEEQFADLAPRIGAEPARDRLLAQLHDRAFDEALARRRRRARPSGTRTWSSTSVWRDVRYGLRSLRRSPGTVVAGVAALALGIGLATVMYSVLYGTFIKGLPFEDSARIAGVYYADPAREDDQIPFADFVRYARQHQSFQALGGYYLGTANVSGGDRPDRVGTARVTAGVFDVLRVRALLGRTFIASDNEPTSPPTAVLSHAIWRDRYASDSAAVGKTVRVNGRPYTIVGVMPEGFEFPLASTALWLPVQTDPVPLHIGQGPGLALIGRLRPGVGFERANAEFATMSHQLAPELPRGATERRAVVEPFIRATLPGRVYALLYAMFGAVLAVLLVACANVATLLLHRAAERTREIGIRTALGASRLAVVRQSLVESGILALLAAILGTAVAQAGIVMFRRAFTDDNPPFWIDIRLHPPVLMFVVVVTIVASLFSGLLPALQSARLDIGAILKDESHAVSALRVGRLGRTIVGVEIALSSALLVGAGFMTKSIIRIRALEPRIASTDVLTARVSLTGTDTLAQRRFFETLERELTAVPGLTGVYVGNGLPATGWGGGPRGSALAVEGRTYARRQDYPTARTLAVSPGFFQTFGVSVLRGRAITASDRAESPRVAVVSESFVQRYFPGAEPIGHRIRIGAPGSEGEWLTIVGVIPTLYAASILSNSENHWPPEVLTAFWQEGRLSSASVALRGPASVASAATLRKAVAALDPDVPVYATAAMDELIRRSASIVHLFGTMFVIFGVVSLVLAAIGLYAVMAFSVSRRVREMGIRMALGASSGHVIRMICRQGARQIAIGMSIGLVAGAAVMRAARASLFEVQPNDPTVFALVAAVLGVAAFVACMIPAVGATRVDPLVALRTE